MTVRILMGVVFLVALAALLIQRTSGDLDRRKRRWLVAVQFACFVVLTVLLISGGLTAR